MLSLQSMPKSNSLASLGQSSSHMSEFRCADRKALCQYVYKTAFGARTETYRLEMPREGHHRPRGAVSFGDSHGQNSNILKMYVFTEMNSPNLLLISREAQPITVPRFSHFLPDILVLGIFSH